MKKIFKMIVNANWKEIKYKTLRNGFVCGFIGGMADEMFYEYETFEVLCLIFGAAYILESIISGIINLVRKVKNYEVK